MTKPNPLKITFDLWISLGNSPLRFREFREEYSKFIFVVRILRQHRKNNSANIRLLLNHIVILYNVFGPTITPLFFLITEESLWDRMLTVLTYLNRIPLDKKLEIESQELDLTGINIISELKLHLESL